MTVLSARALNRATLARQLLLDRADLPVLDAVGHLCGLQAQEPQEPFVGLWSRVEAFDPTDLSNLLTQRRVVRTHLMRRTVHLLTADDVIAWRSRHDSMLRQRVLGTYRLELDGVDLEKTAAAASAVMSDGQPRTAAELVRAMNLPDVPARALGELLIAALVPVVQTPPRGLWRGKGGVRNVLLTHWLGRELEPPTDGEELVLRYLAAFGPAATADIRAWSGIAGLPAAVKALKPQLKTFRDERGRELLDLPDAPRPDPDTPAPIRFLPSFDNALLGYDDRTRIVDDEHRNLSVAGERVVLVDGRVAATWTVAKGTVAVTPLRPFSRKEKTTVHEEADRLSDFLTRPETPAAATGPGPSG